MKRIKTYAFSKVKTICCFKHVRRIPMFYKESVDNEHASVTINKMMHCLSSPYVS